MFDNYSLYRVQEVLNRSSLSYQIGLCLNWRMHFFQKMSLINTGLLLRAEYQHNAAKIFDRNQLKMRKDLLCGSHSQDLRSTVLLTCWLACDRSPEVVCGIDSPTPCHSLILGTHYIYLKLCSFIKEFQSIIINRSQHLAVIHIVKPVNVSFSNFQYIAHSIFK